MAKFTYKLDEELKIGKIYNEEGVFQGEAPIHRLNDNDWRLKVDKIITTGKKWVGIGKKDAPRLEGEFDDTPATTSTGSSRLTLEKCKEYLTDDEALTFEALYNKAKAKFEETHKNDKIDKKLAQLQAMMEKLQAMKSQA